MQFTPGRPPAPTVGSASRSISRHDMGCSHSNFCTTAKTHSTLFPYTSRSRSAFCTGAPLPGFLRSERYVHFGSAPPAQALAKAVTPGSPILLLSRSSVCVWHIWHIKRDCQAWRTRVREVSKRGVKAVRPQHTCNCAIAPMAPLNTE